jgi:hypothetical protein
MPHEYGDHPVPSEAIKTAVTLTVELRSRRQSMSIEELATEAVGSIFRTRVTWSGLWTRRSARWCARSMNSTV